MGRAGGGGSSGGHSGGFSGGGHSGGFSGGGRSGGFSGGGRSGGFSGGGRAGGGSSGRSGGSHGGGHHGGHYGGGFYGGGGYYGGFGGPRPPRPPRRPRRRYIFFGPRVSTGIGCSVFVWLLILVVAMAAVFSMSVAGNRGIASMGNVTTSSVVREKLPASAVQETGYYTDEEGWIRNSGQLEAGMKSFYKQTGIQPYLYILKSDSVTDVAQLQNIAIQKYDELFEDKAHFIVVLCDDNREGTYHAGYHIGEQAKAILDAEAISIFADYLDQYYASDLSEEQFLSQTYAKTAERIMTVTKSPVPYVAIAVCVVIVVALLIVFLNKRADRKAAEAKRAEDILNTPLEKFGDQDVEDLAKKYEKKE